MLHRIAIAVIVLWTIIAQATIEIPKALPQELIVDYAQALTTAQRTSLSEKLRGYYVATSNVVVVVTIPSLEAVGQPTIQDWNMKLADTWKPGNAKKDNGVILTIVGTKAPYKVRINPGRGLEGPLTDAFCKRLIEDVMKPILNKTDGYYDGINVAVDGLVKQIGKEFSPDKKQEGEDTSLLILLAIVGCTGVLGLGLLMFWPRRKEIELEQTFTRPSYSPPKPHISATRRPEPSRVRSRPSEERSRPITSSYSDLPSSSDSKDSSPIPSIGIEVGGGFSGGGAGD